MINEVNLFIFYGKVIFKWIFQIFRKLILFSATITVEPKVTSTSQDEKKSLCRPSELPIYTEEDSSKKEVEQHDGTEEVVLQFMENIFLKTHRKYSDLCTDIDVFTKGGIDSYERTKDHVESMHSVKFLITYRKYF